jgi:hypothetical protein
MSTDLSRYMIEQDPEPPNSLYPWKVTMPDREWHTNTQYNAVRQLRVVMEQEEYEEEQRRHALPEPVDLHWTATTANQEVTA